MRAPPITLEGLTNASGLLRSPYESKGFARKLGICCIYKRKTFISPVIYNYDETWLYIQKKNDCTKWVKSKIFSHAMEAKW